MPWTIQKNIIYIYIACMQLHVRTTDTKNTNSTTHIILT